MLNTYILVGTYLVNISKTWHEKKFAFIVPNKEKQIKAKKGHAMKMKKEVKYLKEILQERRYKLKNNDTYY